jgi:hypothetical protein
MQMQMQTQTGETGKEDRQRRQAKKEARATTLIQTGSFSANAGVLQYFLRLKFYRLDGTGSGLADRQSWVVVGGVTINARDPGYCNHYGEHSF